mmetsp:Transcript_14579/g.29331  ORF Transcript_14579/g.29331 Transcript_14579/m.29331 type:complete len:151 (+) Transcript_14579:565-1017(+)
MIFDCEERLRLLRQEDPQFCDPANLRDKQAAEKDLKWYRKLREFELLQEQRRRAGESFQEVPKHCLPEPSLYPEVRPDTPRGQRYLQKSPTQRRVEALAAPGVWQWICWGAVFTWRGTVWAAQKVWTGACWVAQKTWEGVQWVWQQISRP